MIVNSNVAEVEIFAKRRHNKKSEKCHIIPDKSMVYSEQTFCRAFLFSSVIFANCLYLISIEEEFSYRNSICRQAWKWGFVWSLVAILCICCQLSLYWSLHIERKNQWCFVISLVHAEVEFFSLSRQITETQNFCRQSWAFQAELFGVEECISNI